MFVGENQFVGCLLQCIPFSLASTFDPVVNLLADTIN